VERRTSFDVHIFDTMPMRLVLIEMFKTLACISERRIPDVPMPAPHLDSFAIGHDWVGPGKSKQRAEEMLGRISMEEMRKTSESLSRIWKTQTVPRRLKSWEYPMTAP